MDKLSLYEILSFVVPGFVAIQIAEFFNSTILENEKWFNYESKFEESLILFCLSFFVGILIHIITFRFIGSKKLKWYKKLIFKSPQEISEKNKFIQKVIPFLNEDYANTRKHDEEVSLKSEAAPNLFDYAYLYLETNDKVTPSKNFQSMYFWFRNMFTICLLTLIVTFIFITASYFFDFHAEARKELLILLVKVTTIGLLLIPTANWLREKLIEKVLWSYYVERTHKIIEK